MDKPCPLPILTLERNPFTIEFSSIDMTNAVVMFPRKRTYFSLNGFSLQMGSVRQLCFVKTTPCLVKGFMGQTTALRGEN